eukprot:gene13209-biopygen15564
MGHRQPAPAPAAPARPPARPPTPVRQAEAAARPARRPSPRRRRRPRGRGRWGRGPPAPEPWGLWAAARDLPGSPESPGALFRPAGQPVFMAGRCSWPAGVHGQPVFMAGRCSWPAGVHGQPGMAQHVFGKIGFRTFRRRRRRTPDLIPGILGGLAPPPTVLKGPWAAVCARGRPADAAAAAFFVLFFVVAVILSVSLSLPLIQSWEHIFLPPVENPKLKYQNSCPGVARVVPRRPSIALMVLKTLVVDSLTSRVEASFFYGTPCPGFQPPPLVP